MILIALIIAVMFMTSENIQLEYATGMELILNGSVNGRSNRRFKKYIAGVIFTVFITFAAILVEYIYLYKIYGMPYLQAPALSLQSINDKLGQGIYSFKIVRNIIVSVSIGEYILLRSAIELLIVCIGLNVSALISYSMKGKINRAFIVGTVAAVIAMVVYIRIKIL